LVLFWRLGRLVLDRNRYPTMKTAKLMPIGLLFICLMASSLRATTIQIDLGPPARYTNTQLGPLSFSNLNGTPVNGSTLSLNFLFTGGEFVQLLSNTTKSFDIGLALQTDAGTFPGFVTHAMAHLIAQDGTAISGTTNVIGRADSSDGATFAGFFPLLANGSGTPNTSLSFPLDFYGVHFAFNLPDDPGVMIIGGDLTLFGQGKFSQFAVGPLPDTGNTLMLLFIGVSGLIAAKMSARTAIARVSGVR
jgi:hypothetical protein